jgi:hypothetical protein
MDILDKLAEAKDALALVEMAAASLKSSPMVLGCGFVESLLDEARTEIEALRAEAPT